MGLKPVKFMPETCRLLIVEDDPALAALLGEYLGESNYHVQVINDGDSAIELLSREHFDLVLSDIMLPGASGLAILEKAGGDAVRTIVVLMTGYSGIDDALSAVRKGAYDFVSKPFQLPEIRIRLDNAVRYQQLLRQQQVMSHAVQDASQAAGNSRQRDEHAANQKAEQTAVKVYSSLMAGGR